MQSQLFAVYNMPVASVLADGARRLAAPPQEVRMLLAFCFLVAPPAAAAGGAFSSAT
jgi:hypothetical protein